MDLRARSGAFVNDAVEVFVDSDRNPATGNRDGAEYSIYVFTDSQHWYDQACKWQGSSCPVVSTPTLSARTEGGTSSTYSLIFSIHRSDLGNPTAIGLYVGAFYQDSRGVQWSDWAPNYFKTSYQYDVVVTGPTPQCADALDNDGDGKVDYPADPGCASSSDTTESPDPALPQCSDGHDNDGDGKVDHPADPGCTGSSDTTESPDPAPPRPQCSDGSGTTTRTATSIIQLIPAATAPGTRPSRPILPIPASERSSFRSLRTGSIGQS